MILSPLNGSVKMSSPLEEKYLRHDRGDDYLDPTIPEPAGGT
jgi:hypothetical protein